MYIDICLHIYVHVPRATMRSLVSIDWSEYPDMPFCGEGIVSKSSPSLMMMMINQVKCTTRQWITKFTLHVSSIYIYTYTHIYIYIFIQIKVISHNHTYVYKCT
jgi:hypothetical protein